MTGVAYADRTGRVITIPAEQIKAESTHGVGDEFVGALAVAFAQGTSIEAPLQAATTLRPCWSAHQKTGEVDANALAGKGTRSPRWETLSGAHRPGLWTSLFRRAEHRSL